MTGQHLTDEQFTELLSGEYPIELTDISGGARDRQLSLLADVA